MGFVCVQLRWRKLVTMWLATMMFRRLLVGMDLSGIQIGSWNRRQAVGHHAQQYGNHGDGHHRSAPVVVLVSLVGPAKL